MEVFPCITLVLTLTSAAHITSAAENGPNAATADTSLEMVGGSRPPYLKEPLFLKLQRMLINACS